MSDTPPAVDAALERAADLVREDAGERLEHWSRRFASLGLALSTLEVTAIAVVAIETADDERYWDAINQRARRVHPLPQQAPPASAVSRPNREGGDARNSDAEQRPPAAMQASGLDLRREFLAEGRTHYSELDEAGEVVVRPLEPEADHE